MRYNSTPNPFTKYLKERMKKKKKKRAEKGMGPAQLSTPREREIGRTEGREHGDRARQSNSSEGRGQRQAGSDRGRVG